MTQFSNRLLLPVALAVLAGTTLPPRLAGQTATDPLGDVVSEALRNNLGLAQENLAVERAEAGVREARGRFFPSLTLDSRYSEQSGAPSTWATSSIQPTPRLISSPARIDSPPISISPCRSVTSPGLG
jgi:outer membrane protein TolC